MSSPDSTFSKRNAVRFIVFLGVVSLFADVTYEGARSISGPFLNFLGASATAVGIIAGLGELAGYALRYVSGTITDRVHHYWTITIIGYVVNMLAVPLLAFAGRWEVAALLLVLERTGKAIRNPARDAMLAHASHTVGQGWGFGLHEAMDQTGALIGPLLVAWILATHAGYHVAFAWLAIPAVLALTSLMIARRAFPHPMDMEVKTRWQHAPVPQHAFWLYTAGGALLALGYADYPLIAFHFAKSGIISTSGIPLLYALAMVTSVVGSLVFGKLFDTNGIASSVAGILLGAAAAPLVFLGNETAAIIGMGVWGVGLGVQGSSLRAGIAHLISPDRRASAYGRFDAIFGIAWFAGSAIIGVMYEWNILALVSFAVIAQIASIPCLIMAMRHRTNGPRAMV